MSTTECPCTDNPVGFKSGSIIYIPQDNSVITYNGIGVDGFGYGHDYPTHVGVINEGSMAPSIPLASSWSYAMPSLAILLIIYLYKRYKHA